MNLLNISWLSLPWRILLGLSHDAWDLLCDRDRTMHDLATQKPFTFPLPSDFQIRWTRPSPDLFLILLLCVIQEGGRTKSHRYWPKLGSKHSSATYGKFKVTTKFRTDSGCYATTGLKVKHLLSGQERTVWHLQYTDWPDHGCPEDVQGFLCKFFSSHLEFYQRISGLISWE